MSIFEDRVIQGMDDLSVLISPYTSKLITMWASLPTEIIINRQQNSQAIMRLFDTSYSWNREMSARDVLDGIPEFQHIFQSISNIGWLSYDAKSKIYSKATVTVSADCRFQDRMLHGEIKITIDNVLTESELLAFAAQGIGGRHYGRRQYKILGQKICKLLDIPNDPSEIRSYRGFLMDHFAQQLETRAVLLRDVDKFMSFTAQVMNCFRNGEIDDQTAKNILLYKVTSDAGQPFYDISGWSIGGKNGSKS